LVVRLTPVLPEALAFVLPKFSEPLEVLIVKPIPVGFVRVVVGLGRLCGATRVDVFAWTGGVSALVKSLVAARRSGADVRE